MRSASSIPEEDLRQGLGRLRAAELVHEAGLFPDIEYTFTHALTLEVAYRGLLQERRSALHARLVVAMESLYSNRLDEHAERLDEAARMAQRALEALPVHPGFGAHAHHLLGDIASHSCPFDAAAAEAHYREALALAEARGMRPLIAFCHLGLARLYGRANERPRSIEHMNVATGELRALDVPWWLERAEAPATS
jgi:tetratricopeptide (TPR) repeat protein